jgi:hypothetical protein
MITNNQNSIKTYKYRRNTAAIITALIFIVISISTALQSDINQETTDNNTTNVAFSTISAAESLDKLEIKGRAPKTGYSRSQFGDGWGTADGCDLRNLILQRDLNNDELDNTNCQVKNGVLQQDPYTGESITFVRGAQTSSAVQIDHVVALSDAWQKGAQNISYQDRVRIANDPLNLLAVDGPTNIEKGDKDAASWLPPNKSYRCMYVARQIAVKVKYKLWVTKAEHSAMKRTLSNCPNQKLPQEFNAGLSQ